jgi:hypothetical protein
MRKEYKQKLKEIINKNPSGFSINLNSLENVKKGYVVSFTHINKNKNIDNILKRIDFIKYAFPQLKKNLVLGGWYNKKDNCFYLDLGLNLKNKKHSLIIGKYFKQIAIFDINKLKEINV